MVDINVSVKLQLPELELLGVTEIIWERVNELSRTKNQTLSFTAGSYDKTNLYSLLPEIVSYLILSI